MYAELEEEDDFTELVCVPNIQGRASVVAESIAPDFLSHKVADLFHSVGPLAMFSSRHSWSAPRTITLDKPAPPHEYGFSVRGDSPVIVAAVETQSLAHVSEMIVAYLSLYSFVIYCYRFSPLLLFYLS